MTFLKSSKRGGDDEEGLGKSRKQLRNPFVLDEAECSSGSSDKEHNDHEYETKADTDFVSDAPQQNDTDTSHRQCDNLDLSREGHSAEQERGRLIDDGNEQTDWWEEAFIFDAEDQQEPPDYDELITFLNDGSGHYKITFKRAMFEAAAKQDPPDYDGFQFLF